MYYIIDLETPIMKAGFKRADVLILSIGCISLFDDRQYHTFVRVKEAEFEQKTKSAPTNKIISRIKYDASNALPVKEALQQLFEFTGNTPLFIAHNGNSFDFKIIDGAIEACALDYQFTALDSYHYITKKVFALPSYKLSNVYYSICKNHKKLKFHRAIDDCVALKAIVIECGKTYIQQNLTYAYRALYQQINQSYGTSFTIGMTVCKESRKRIEEALLRIEICDPIMQIIMQYCIKEWARKGH